MSATVLATVRPPYGSRCAATAMPVGVRRGDDRRQPDVLRGALSPPRDRDLVDPGGADLVHLLRAITSWSDGRVEAARG